MQRSSTMGISSRSDFRAALIISRIFHIKHMDGLRCWRSWGWWRKRSGWRWQCHIGILNNDLNNWLRLSHVNWIGFRIHWSHSLWSVISLTSMNMNIVPTEGTCIISPVAATAAMEMSWRWWWAVSKRVWDVVSCLIFTRSSVSVERVTFCQMRWWSVKVMLGWDERFCNGG